MTPGTIRGAGRPNPLAASGPRNRMSSSVSMIAVPRSSTHVTATLDTIVIRSGIIPVIGSAIMNDEEPRPLWLVSVSFCCLVGGGVKASCETTIWPVKGTAGTRPFLLIPGSSAIPASALISKITGVSVFCASFTLFEAVVTARLIADATEERPMNERRVMREPCPIFWR